MKKVKVLLCMLSLAALGVLTACDDDDGGDGSGGGGGGTNDVVVPATLDDRIMTVTATGTAPFAESGTYTVTFGPADSGTYSIADADGAAISDGTYTYAPQGDNTAFLDLQDSVLGQIFSTLTFDSSTSGSIHSEDTTGGTEDGTFTLN